MYGMVWYGMVWYGMVWYGMHMHAKNTSTQQNTCVSDCAWCMAWISKGNQSTINNQQSTINNQQSTINTAQQHQTNLNHFPPKL
jgi:hypothetical protein